MARRNFENSAATVRLDRKEAALAQALLVRWPELEAAVQEYVEWHGFALWVRAVSESADGLPVILRAELGDRCPGFLQWAETQPRPIWKSLDEWVARHRFGAATQAGWFDALTYYAYRDLRVDQGWALWERTRVAWEEQLPFSWPTLREWRTQLGAITTLAQENSEKARALAAAASVDTLKLNIAVSHLIESRAFAFWVDCVSKPNQWLDSAITNEVCQRCPELESGKELTWRPSLFLRLIRCGESEYRRLAREEKWFAALRYRVVHHPRYHRLIHYRQRCHDEWPDVRPISLPAFSAWLAAADAYAIRRAS